MTCDSIINKGKKAAESQTKKWGRRERFIYNRIDEKRYVNGAKEIKDYAAEKVGKEVILIFSMTLF